MVPKMSDTKDMVNLYDDDAMAKEVGLAGMRMYGIVWTGSLIS